MTVNVHEEMNNSINILLDSDKPAAEYEYALDVIGEHVDTIDYANGNYYHASTSYILILQ